METWADRGRADRARSRPARTCPTCSWSPATTSPGCCEEELTQPVDQLLDERGVDFGDDYSRDAIAGVQRRQPAAVHAVRHLADGDLLQQGPRRLRPDGGAGASTYRRGRGGRGPADLDLRPVRRRRRLRHPPAPRHQGRVRRADAARALAPFIYSGGGPMFDDETDPTSLAFSDDSTQDALERSLELFRSPTLTLTEEQLERAHAAGVVQARQARDDGGLPRAWSPGCAGCRASTST